MEEGNCQLTAASDKSNTDQLEGTRTFSDNSDVFPCDISSLASYEAIAAREAEARPSLEGEAISSPSEDETCELVTNRVAPASGRPQADFVSDELDFALPSPPSDLPEVQERKDSVPISNDNVDSIPSSLSERDSYTWNSAMCDLPNPLILNDNEEKIISSHEDELAVSNGFEENIDYKLSIRIGGGAFGTCYLAVTPVPDPAGDTNEERVFCVKKCEYRHDEILALKLASDKHIAEIVQFYGAKLTGRNARIFMEFVAGGTIKDLIEVTKKERKSSEMSEETSWAVISEDNSLCYLEDVLKALKFLHANGIVHRDVKGANALLTEYRLHAKLADFGSAASINKENPPSVDIWSTGCLILEMLEGNRSPLFARDRFNLEDYIPAKATSDIKDLLRLVFGANITDEGYPLLTAEEILRESKAFPVKEFLERRSR